MKLLIPVFIVALFFSCAKKETQTYPIDSFMDGKIKELGIVGMAAAVLVDKQLVWTNGYGFADKDKRTPMTANTIMNIGSISKTITGASIMLAIEQGKLLLDADINGYLPFKIVNPHFPNEIITLRRLGTHTSGIYDRSEVYDSTYHYGGDAPEPLGEFLRNYFVPGGKYYSEANFLNSKPGTRESYSNIGAGLAGFVVETVTGEKLNDFSMKNIFTPLGMNDTGWFLSEIKLENHSSLYEGGVVSGEHQQGPKVIKLYGLVTYPDGGVRTSVTDLSKFFVCLLNDGESDGVHVLKKESVMEMTRPQFTEANKPDSVNLTKNNSGIFWDIKDQKQVGHGGGDPGVMTIMAYDTEKRVGQILFLNTDIDVKNFREISGELWRFGESLKEKL